MQVVVGSAEAWQLPLNVVALEWKAELLRYAGFDLLAGLHQGWEMHLLASGLQRSPSLYQRELLAGAASRYQYNNAGVAFPGITGCDSATGYITLLFVCFIPS